MKRYLHENIDGLLVISSISEKYEEEFLSNNKAVIVKNDFNVDFLAAYELANNGYSLNIEKARAVKQGIIRMERDFLFEDFDKRYDIALKDDSDLTELQSERQFLKDLPEIALVAMKNMTTLEEINNLTIGGLKNNTSEEV